MMSERELWLRAIRFERPDRIPLRFGINFASWAHYGKNRVQEWVESHPLLFPWARTVDWKTFQPWCSPHARVDKPYTDPWGCVWQTAEEGIMGTVVKHPLASWDDFARYRPPDPNTTNGSEPINWGEIKGHLAQAKARGELTWCGLPHGHTFLLLTYLRGFENLTFDMADGEPRLLRLLDMVGAFNEAVIQHYIEAGVDIMSYPEDLGMQNGPMLSPSHFRRYIQPLYRRIMAPARAAGCLIHMHSDGDLRELVADILACGVDCLNLQDLVNGVDWIAAHLKGRVCVDVDIDRQTVTRWGSPRDIEAHVQRLVRTLGDPRGGLCMIYGLYPGLPPENVEAVMDAMEKYSTHFS